MKVHGWLTLCLAASILLLSGTTANAANDDWWRSLPVRAVKVIVHTETDDKDSEEAVTLRVSYGPFSADTTVGQGEVWGDQVDKTFEIGLPLHPPAGATFELRVTKTRQGSPTGHGWDVSFEMFAILEQGGQMQLYINGDRNSPRSAKFTMGDGERNPNDVVVMSGARAIALPGGRLSSAIRPTVRFNGTSTRPRLRQAILTRN
jgi:hypothetical protein